jgi:NinB protein
MLLRTFVLRGDVQAKSLWAFLKANWPSMAQQGKPLAVTVSEYKTKRSLEQNARYFGYVLKEVEAKAWVNGRQFDAEVWHEHMKRKILGCVELPNGQLMGRSTAALSVAEFSEYMLKVEAYAATELGVELSA